MEYKVHDLSKIAGVSTRTLRYYDEIGILHPRGTTEAGYRLYGAAEIDRLQEILFYRELGVGLEEIRKILDSKDFDREKSLKGHLDALLKKQEELGILIQTVKKTISTLKGEKTMRDQEKFEGFKKEMLEENEAQYGTEIREKYGEEAVEASNKKFMSLSKEQFKEAEDVQNEFAKALKEALATGDPAGELAQEACELHKKWLSFFAKYSKEYHKGLADMYMADERFKAYYDKIADGACAFFHDAIMIYCQK